MHPLQAQIAAVRRRARRLGWIQGTCRFATIAVISATAWMLSDYAFRYQEHGVRVLGFIAVLGASIWAAVRYLAPLFAWRLTDIDVAQTIDRRLPAVANRTASALEFATLAVAGSGASSVAAGGAGSTRLRESILAQTSTALADVNLDEVLDYRPTFLAAAGALGAFAFAAAFFFASPDASRLAAQRFVNPALDLPWPPRHQLAFDPPVDHLAQGDAFEIRVAERDGNLPKEVWIEYADADDRPSLDAAESRLAMQRRGDAMHARRENVRASFWYRATGGDDTAMPWRQLIVVKPPQLTTCQITVHPPAYTMWPPASSQRAIRALVGSRIAIEATANRPIETAAVVLESGMRIPLVVDSSGLKLSLSADSSTPSETGVAAPKNNVSNPTTLWEIDDSRSYNFDVVARDGTRSSQSAEDRWEIQPIADLPPVVTLEAPLAVVYATPEARVPIRAYVFDDLAVSRASLVVRCVSASKSADLTASTEQSHELFNAGPKPLDKDQPLARWPRAHRVGPLEANLKLAELSAAAGDTIELEVVAADLKRTETRSPTHRILVVSSDEFLERAMDRQAHIAEQLFRAFELARQSQRSFAGLNVKIRQSGALDESNRDTLRAAETEHRQLVRILMEPGAGVAPLCESLLADLKANGAQLPDRNRRIERIRTELRRLEREDFGPFDRTLTEVWTGLRSPSPTADMLSGGFSAAIARHDRIVATLAVLHESLAHWDNLRRVSREVAEIRRIEQGLISRSAELARMTLGARIEALPADTRAELVQLVESQRDLRRRLDRAHSRMDKLQSSVASDDPHAAGILADAIDFLAANPLGGSLSTAADKIAANQLAQAAQTQARAIELLGELLAVLDNRPETDPERQAKRLAAAAARLEALRAELAPPLSQLRGAVNESDAARKAVADNADTIVQSLARELGKLSREAIRLDSLPAAEHVARSAASLREITKSLIERPADITKTGNAADADLAAAARLLAAHARQIESQRIREQLVALGDAAAGLLRRQEMLLAESKAFQQFASSATAEAWRSATVDAIDRQQKLSRETADIAKSTTVDAFATLLRAASEEMEEAATLLAVARQLSRATDLQRLIIGRLRQIVAATAPRTDARQSPPPRVNDAPEETPSPPTGPVHVIEELRLVRSMQAALNDRTAAFHVRQGTAALSDDAQRDLSALATEQQRVAELFRKLFVAPSAPATTDEPPDPTQQPPPTGDVPSPLGS
jgi:hypothetical protein